MKKRMTGWVVGGLIAVTVLGLTISTNIGSAAEKNATQSMPGMVQNGQMGTMDPQMMNSPEMQKQCFEMMKNADMQQAMKGMMKTPEMQAMMKQMLTSDPELRQIMSDLVNSIDPNDQSSKPVQPSSTPASSSGMMDHSAHH